MIETLTIGTIMSIIKWTPLIGGAIWGLFKGYQWVKDVREKDLKQLKQNMADLHTGIEGVRAAIDTQTQSLVAELREQRQDFRTFYAPLLTIAAGPTPARAKKTPPKKKTATKK